MDTLRKLLLPFVPIYFAVTWLRNLFYDWGILASKSFNIPIICVGNLSVGGTGKTPMIEHVVRLLKNDYKIATLSRGYGRQSKGFILADNTVDAKVLGDEPFQFYSKFGNEVTITVDENRVRGIKTLLKKQPATALILLDDAFQHRKVKPGFNILLTTYSSPFFNDILLPTGDLREPRHGYKRANIIVVTKCPEQLSKVEKERYVEKIKPLPHQTVMFSSINYANEVLSEGHENKRLEDLGEFTLVTGIANANPLVAHLKHKNLNFEHLHFKDHHQFKHKDINLLKDKALILTTEKDYVRLKSVASLKDKLFYIPITLTVDKENELLARLLAYVGSY